MVSRIVTVAQQKGGAGKTTVAINLAVQWAASGLNVAILDIDPQASITAWSSIREGQKGLAPLTISAVSGWRTATEIDRLKGNHDLVVIDSPPHAETAARAAVRASDLTVVPVQLSPMDLWATGATIELARAERRPVMLVLNRVPPRGHLADTIRSLIAEKNLPLARTALGNRQAFAAAVLAGQGVAEAEPGSPAAEEIAALAQELHDRLNQL